MVTIEGSGAVVDARTGAPVSEVGGSTPPSPTITLVEESVERFFRFARERHAIYLRRRAGAPRPWTGDAILRQYRFTNVYRELDKTTAWFRQYVRDPLREKPEVLLATVLFRWFNTIRSGETIFTQLRFGGRTSWEEYLEHGDPALLEGPLRLQGPPWVTGAYMIRSPEGMDKLDGILKSVDDFRRESGWRVMAEKLLGCREQDPMPLSSLWSWLRGFYGLGPFLAYEIVTDLRHTALLDRAPDIMTWANPGPGALRGAALLVGDPERVRKGRLKKATYPEAHAVMEELLRLSRDERYWPQMTTRLATPEDVAGLGGQVNPEQAKSLKRPDGQPIHKIDLRIADTYRSQLADVFPRLQPGDFPAWEMREPEMWLCEFAKYERTRLGFGRPRGTFER